MIHIHFSDAESERRAIGCLIGRFSFKSWATRDMVVPEPALAFLGMKGIPFSVQGPATYEQLIPAIRNPAPSPVQ